MADRILLAASIGCFLMAGAAAPAAASDCPDIGVAEGGAYSEETAALVGTIFERAALCARIVLAPQTRIDLMEKQGALKGDAWRDDSYLAANPFLVKVPTAVQHFSVSLYWRQDLGDPSRTPGAIVGILMGRGWARDLLRDLQVTVFEASTYRQLLKLARSGRVRAFVMPTLTFDKLSAEEKTVPDSFRGRKLSSLPLYLALDRRIESEVPALDAAIKNLWAEGYISDQPTPDHSPASR